MSLLKVMSVLVLLAVAIGMAALRFRRSKTILGLMLGGLFSLCALGWLCDVGAFYSSTGFLIASATLPFAYIMWMAVGLVPALLTTPKVQEETLESLRRENARRMRVLQAHGGFSGPLFLTGSLIAFPQLEPPAVFGVALICLSMMYLVVSLLWLGGGRVKAT